MMFLVKFLEVGRNPLILLLLAGPFMFFNFSAKATQSVTLGWDSSFNPDVVGYNIYYGTASLQYTSKVSAGNGTVVTIGGLLEGVTYYFAATTYNAIGQESGFSEEASYTVPGVLAVPPPPLNNFVAGQNLFFNLAAFGTGPLNYQWQLNSTNLPSATNASFTLPNITTNQAGTYSVTISDGAGLTTNFIFNVAVYPTAAATLKRTVPANGQFSFDVSGVGGFQYVVQASTNLTDWSPVQTNTSPFSFADADTNQFARRFYRSVAILNQAATTNTAATASPDATASPATLAQPAYANGRYSFNVSGGDGAEYIIQASADLVNWVSVQTNLAPFVFTDPNAGQFNQRFYRTLAANGITASLIVSANTAATLGQAACINNQFIFQISGVADYQYVVQASTNMVDWISVQTNKAPFTFVDQNAGQFSQRFYRAF